MNMSTQEANVARETAQAEGQFEPKIIAFCCNWCSYAGADLAGVSRLQMPTNFLVLRAMCSARVDPEFVLRAFAKGADGVLVLGCHPAQTATTLGGTTGRGEGSLCSRCCWNSMVWTLTGYIWNGCPHPRV